MNAIRKTLLIFYTLSLPMLFISCNGMFKHDKNSNCLNPATSCYVPDITAPEVTDVQIHKDSTFATVEAPGTTVSTLYAIDITYSEIMLNANDESLFSFTGVGANDLAVSNIVKLSDTKFRYVVSGTVRNGEIQFSSEATDVTHRSLQNVTGLYPVTFTGNVDVSVSITSIESNYLTTNTGSGTEYNDIDIIWQHNYIPDDAANTTQAWLKLGEECVFNTGSDITNLTDPADGSNFSSSALSENTPVTTNLKASALAAGNNTLYICIENLTENKHGYAEIPLVLDNTLPDSRLSLDSPIGGSYPEVQNIDLECTDSNCAMIAYTENATDPTFSSGSISNGIQYSETWKTPYVTDSTDTTLRFRAMDRAGNIETTVHEQVYKIDSRVPNLTLSGTISNSYFKNGDILSLDVTSSLQGERQLLLDPAGGCPASTDGSWTGIDDTSKDTPFNYSFTMGTDITGDEVHTILICVLESETGQDLVGSFSRSIFIDNTAPVFAGATSATPDGSNMILSWTAAEDDSLVYYDIYRLDTTPANPSEVFADGVKATTENSSVSQNCSINDITKKITCTLSGYDSNTIYHFGVRARDAAGNAEANENVVRSGLQILVTSTGVSGGTATVTLNDETNLSFTSSTVKAFSTIIQTDYEYSVEVTASPPGQVCAFAEKQFGTADASSDIEFNLNCVNGYANSQGVNDVPPAPLDYRLFNGKMKVLMSNSATQIQGLAYFSGSVYSAAANTPSLSKHNTTSGVETVIIGDLTGHTPLYPVTDGTNLYVSDTTASKIVKYDLAGSPIHTFDVSSLCQNPRGLALEPGTSNLYISCNGNNVIAKLDYSVADGLSLLSSDSSLNDVFGIVLLNSKLYLANYGAHTILEINTTTGAVTRTIGTAGSEGYQDGAISQSLFTRPSGITTDGVNNLFVVDVNGGNYVRKIDLKKGVVSTLAGTGAVANPTMNTGINLGFQYPRAITSDGRNLYVGDVFYISKLSDNGLVGYWPLAATAIDYNSDGAAAIAGTIVDNTTATYGRYSEPNGSYKFDGNGDYIDTKANLSFANTSPFSFSVWVNPTDLSDSGVILAKSSIPANTYVFRLAAFPDGSVSFISWNTFNTNSLSAYSGAGALQLNKWTHIVYTYDGKQQNGGRFYINGKPMAPGSYGGGTIKTTSDSLKIGGGYVSANPPYQGVKYFTGSIADVRVYARALNEGEINELAQDADPALVGDSYSSGATGLLSHYEFDNNLSNDSGALNKSFSNDGSPANTEGKDGDTYGSIHFEAVDPTYTLSSSLGLPSGDSPRTICTWVKPEEYPATGQIAYLMEYGNNVDYEGVELYLYNKESTIYIVMGAENLNTRFTGVSKVPLNTWTHICGVYEGGAQGALYENGLDITTKYASEKWDTVVTSGGFRTGAGLDDSAGLQGAIDDLRIYNNPLTAYQVRQLAAQIPAGLIARYDFTDYPGSGKAIDSSGWNNHGEISGLSWEADRFNEKSAYKYSGNSNYVKTSITSLNQAEDTSTVAFWFKLNTLTEDAILFHYDGEYFMYDSASSKLFLDNDAGNGTYSFPAPVDYRYWQHVAITRNGSNAEIYLNGSLFTYKNGTQDTPQGFSNIALGYEFYGALDDVLIYNRVLDPTEIQALVRQPNKRIFVTEASLDGKLISYDDISPYTGIDGADFVCNKDDARPNTSTYKAMLVDEKGCDGDIPCRQACTTENCDDGGTGGEGIAEHIDWVLRPGITYIRPDDTDATLMLPIFTANENGVWDFTEDWNTSIGSSGDSWTGLDTDWTTVTNTCDDWGSASVSGQYGRQIGTSSNAISGGNHNCGLKYYLYCVEQ